MFISPNSILANISPYISDWTTDLSVADFGSGSGDYVIEAARLMDGNGRVYAIDVQKPLLERLSTNAAAREYQNVMTVWSDLEQLGATKIPESSVDVALIINVLFQIEHKDNFMQEVARLLKPGALLILVDWQDSFGGLGPQAENIVTVEVAKNLLEQNQYHVQSAKPTSDHHYIIIAKK